MMKREIEQSHGLGLISSPNEMLGRGASVNRSRLVRDERVLGSNLVPSLDVWVQVREDEANGAGVLQAQMCVD